LVPSRTVGVEPGGVKNWSTTASVYAMPPLIDRLSIGRARKSTSRPSVVTSPAFVNVVISTLLRNRKLFAWKFSYLA